MKYISILFIFINSNSYADLTDIESRHFNSYASYAASGVGFDPEYTYDYNFRQMLVKSKDDELKRAFILKCLPEQISHILRALKDNKKMIGKGDYVELTDKDISEYKDKFQECIKLMGDLDKTNNHKLFIEIYEKNLSEIVNAAKNR